MGNLFSSKNACTREAGGRYLTIIVQLFDEITKGFIISNITNLWANKFQFVKIVKTMYYQVLLFVSQKYNFANFIWIALRLWRNNDVIIVIMAIFVRVPNLMRAELKQVSHKGALILPESAQANHNELYR